MKVWSTDSVKAKLFLLIVIFYQASCNTNDEKVAAMATEIEKLTKDLITVKGTLEQTQDSLRKGVTDKTSDLISKANGHVDDLKQEMEDKFKKVEGTYIDEQIKKLLNNVDKYTNRTVGLTYEYYLKWLERESAKWMGEDEAAWNEKHQWSINRLANIQTSLKNSLADLKKTTDPLKERFDKATSNELTELEKAGEFTGTVILTSVRLYQAIQ